jgi:hypothetical protein
MHKLIAAAAALILAPITLPAWALDDNPVGSMRCQCYCESANTGSFNVYGIAGSSCGPLEGRTCNIENSQTGLIETGRVAACLPLEEESNAGSNFPGMFETSPGVLDNPGQWQTSRPTVVAPMNGLLSR